MAVCDQALCSDFVLLFFSGKDAEAFQQVAGPADPSVTSSSRGQQYLHPWHQPNLCTLAPFSAGAPALGYGNPEYPDLPYHLQPSYSFGPFPPQGNQLVPFPPATATNQFAQQPGGALPVGGHEALALVSLVSSISLPVYTASLELRESLQHYIQDPFLLNEHYLPTTAEDWRPLGYHDGFFLREPDAMTGQLGRFPRSNFGDPMLHNPHGGYHGELLSVVLGFQPLVDDFSFNCRRFSCSASSPNDAGGQFRAYVYLKHEQPLLCPSRSANDSESLRSGAFESISPGSQ